MSSLLIEHLLELNENDNLLYAQLEEKYLKSFSNANTYILYEWLSTYSGYKSTSYIKMSLEDMKVMLGKDKTKSYRLNSEFKRSVLVKSLNELKTIFKIEWEFKKSVKDFDSDEEDFIYITFKKINKKIKLDLNALKASITHFWGLGNPKHFGKKFQDLGYLALNKKKYIYQTNNDENQDFDSDKAKEVWNYLYEVYEKNPKIFYQVFDTTQEDFKEIYNGYKKY